MPEGRRELFRGGEGGEMKAHCLFEQAGTFKNEFIKLGVPCEDYDILNDFGETENKVCVVG